MGNKGTTLAERLIEDLDTVVDTVDTKVGENTDAVGTTTLFARLRQIVDTYLADGTAGLAALKTLIDANQVDLDAIIVDTTSIETKVDTVDTVVDGIQTDLDNATDGLGALKVLIDANQVDLNTIIADTETLLQKATKTITLSTAAVPVTESLFTVTGEVELYIVGYIDTAVTSAGALTLEVGIAGATAGLIAQTAVADLLIDLLWVNATPAVLVSKPSEKIIANGADISHIIKTAAATAGAITYICNWRAISADGNVTVS